MCVCAEPLIFPGAKRRLTLAIGVGVGTGTDHPNVPADAPALLVRWKAAACFDPALTIVPWLRHPTWCHPACLSQPAGLHMVVGSSLLFCPSAFLLLAPLQGGYMLYKLSSSRSTRPLVCVLPVASFLGWLFLHLAGPLLVFLVFLCCFTRHVSFSVSVFRLCVCPHCFRLCRVPGSLVGGLFATLLLALWLLALLAPWYSAFLVFSSSSVPLHLDPTFDLTVFFLLAHCGCGVDSSSSTRLPRGARLGSFALLRAQQPSASPKLGPHALLVSWLMVLPVEAGFCFVVLCACRIAQRMASLLPTKTLALGGDTDSTRSCYSRKAVCASLLINLPHPDLATMTWLKLDLRRPTDVICHDLSPNLD